MEQADQMAELLTWRDLADDAGPLVSSAPVTGTTSGLARASVTGLGLRLRI